MTRKVFKAFLLATCIMTLPMVSFAYDRPAFNLS
jgi:hypothetical protein